MAAPCSAWLLSCLPCGDTLLWPLDEVDCAEASLHPPLQSLDLEQSLLQAGTAPGREEGMYTDTPGMLHLHAPGEQELGRHSKLVFHDSLAEGSQGSWDIDAHGRLLVPLQQAALVKAESPHRYQPLAGTGKGLTDSRQLAQMHETALQGIELRSTGSNPLLGQFHLADEGSFVSSKPHAPTKQRS